MEVKTERHGYTLIAKVEGRVDGANAREFQVALETAIGAGEPAVILDVHQQRGPSGDFADGQVFAKPEG